MSKTDSYVLNNITTLLKQKKKTQKELTDYLGITSNAFTDWKSGRLKSYNKHIPEIARFFHVSVDSLLGYHTPEIETWDLPDEDETGIRTIPVLGCVAGGIPIEMVEDIQGYEQITTDLFPANGEYYGLKIIGDSMAPVIPDGSVVIFRRQDYVDDGKIAIVCVDGQTATCKKIYHKNGGIVLQPLNPDFEAIFYSKDDIVAEPVTVIGKVLEVRKRFE